MKSKWPVVVFGDAVEDVTGGNPKLANSDYLSSGEYPVIDQGQEFISGYSDDSSLLCRRKGELIVFGDHTKAFKFVDFDFVLGADGVKVLKTKDGFDPKFVYYFLRKFRFPENVGYSRHFKFLKECLVPKPPLGEQKRIAAILDKADSLRRKRAQAIALADDFLRATFLEMFGDPVTNYKKWPEREIYEIAKVTTGNTPSRETPENFGSAIEWIKSDNINTPSHWLTKATEGLSEQGLSIGRTVPAGSILMTCIAGSPSCIGNVAMADRQVAFNQQINALTPFEGTEPEFLYGLLLYSKQRVQAASTNSMKGMVSKGGLERVRLIWPSADLQSKYARAFKKIAALREKQFKSDLSPLLSSLQDTLLS